MKKKGSTIKHCNTYRYRRKTKCIFLSNTQFHEDILEFTYTYTGIYMCTYIWSLVKTFIVVLVTLLGGLNTPYKQIIIVISCLLTNMRWFACLWYCTSLTTLPEPFVNPSSVLVLKIFVPKYILILYCHS